MLTQDQCRKNGLQFIDLPTEYNQIKTLSAALSKRIAVLQSSLPVIVTYPPTDMFGEGTKGSIAVDDEFLYICTKQNNWKRILLNEL
jgi:hypothetical protein